MSDLHLPITYNQPEFLFLYIQVGNQYYKSTSFIFNYNETRTQCVVFGNLIYKNSKCSLNVNSNGSIVYRFIGNYYTVGDVIDVYYI